MAVRRSQSGFQIIESLVALILGSLYCVALLQVCAQTMRVTTTNSNRQAADLITQTTLDAMKQTNYSLLQFGTYQLVPYEAPGAPGHSPSVAVDLTNLTWNGTVNSFPGTATLNIGAGPDTTSKTATVTVAWSDSQATSKTISTMAVIHQNGIWNWNPTVLPAQ